MKLFISYAYEDNEIALRIANDLERHSIPFWFDKYEIDAGDNIILEIEEGLDRSDFLCIILTENYVSNRSIARQERTNFLKRAISNSKLKIILLKFDDCKTPILLEAIRYINMKDYENGLNGLLTTLGKVNIYKLIPDFVKPTLKYFSGGRGGGKADSCFKEANSLECEIKLDIANFDAYAGIYFESKNPVNLLGKKNLLFDFCANPIGNKIEIKLGYPEKVFYLENYNQNYSEIKIPLEYFSDTLSLDEVQILTIAMNDSHLFNKPNSERNVQIIKIKNIRFI